MCIYIVLKNGWASLKKHNGSFEGLVKITVLMGLSFFATSKKGHFHKAYYFHFIQYLKSNLLSNLWFVFKEEMLRNRLTA